MKKVAAIITLICILTSSAPIAFGASYNCTVTHIPDDSDAEVYTISDYYYIGDDTIMHKDGRIVTSGKYKFDLYEYYPERFTNGYIEVEGKSSKMRALMNDNGEIVTEVKYSFIAPFDEMGGAVACLDGEKYGMIDKEGNTLVPFEFDYIRTCNHPELLVAGQYKYSDNPNANIVREMNYGLIDRKGNVVLPMEYEDLEGFDEHGFMKTEKKNSWNQGLVNNKGEVILDVEYRNIDYRGEYIRAVDNSQNCYWFDKEGNNIFPQYDYVYMPSGADLQLLITFKDNKRGLAKYDGTILIEAAYDKIEPTVADGFIKLIKNGKVEWARANGELLYDARYEDCDQLYTENDSIYALKQDGLWALAIGEKVGDFKYTEIDDMTYFSDILFCTRQDGVIEAVDSLTAQIIYENVFSGKYGSSYRSRYFYEKDNQAYLITSDKKSQIAWPDKYVYVGEFQNNVAVAKNHENLWGLINEKGEPITEFKYESFYVSVGVNHGDEVWDEYVYHIDNNLAMVKLDGKIGYINLEGEMVIEPKFDGYTGYNYGKFEHGYAYHHLAGGDWCYVDINGNIYEKERINDDYSPETYLSYGYHYSVLRKDDSVEIWDRNKNKRIAYSVGNALYKEDGSFLVDTILKNENGSLKIRYEYDEGFSVWTEFGRFIINIEEK